MRGKVRKLFKICPRFRITPAYAGKRPPVPPDGVERWDHPRLCGEKKLFPVVSVRRLRITPAYAGKSKLFRFFYLCLWDHPRLCGEKE